MRPFSVTFQESILDALVANEWAGVSGNKHDIVCDVTGGVCPWVVKKGLNESDASISTAAAKLMVRLILITPSTSKNCPKESKAR